jgi:2-oxoglutarate dehydrogenase E2 component (dihydrolipoamide succinyltransferase)
MALVEVVLPPMGESIMEATILSWLKKEGDFVEAEESLLEVATDKVDTEVPSSHSGIVKEILYQQGDIIQIGKPIARLEIEVDIESGVKEPEQSEIDTLPEKKKKTPQQSTQTNGIQKSQTNIGSRFYSPLVRNIAKEENISIDELETISGTGMKNRLTKQDLLNYLRSRRVTTKSSPVTSSAGGDEIIEMDRMRKMIAERMVSSKQISPHVTSFVEADLTGIVQWRNKVKSLFQERYGVPLTYTTVILEAVIKALRDFPMINISVDGDKIIRHRDLNLGMAVALPNGNLIVPVIRQADQYNLSGLSKKVYDLAKRARANKIQGEELQGGTYTVSNVGSFGNLMGTPIIVQPQVAILAFGVITKKPAVIETPEGDLIGIRSKMYLSHSYDHRVVDGSLGGMFVKKVADYLENFDVNRDY